MAFCSTVSTASAPATQRSGGVLLVDDREQSLGELGGIVCLLAAHRLPGRPRLGGALGVVVDRQLGVGGGIVGEQLCAEEAGFDDRGVDAERLDLEAQRLHPPLDAELGGGVGGAEGLAGDAGGRADRDDRARTLPAHHGQHRACHVHRPDQIGGQLPLDLLGRQLLEEAGIEVAGVVDEHVDAAEALERRPHRRLRGREARDVELDDQQVVRLAERRTDRLGVAAGRDDGMAGGECGLGDVHAHAAAGAGDEPDLLLTHPVPSLSSL